MLGVVVSQFVMPAVEVEEETPPIWYDSDTLPLDEGWERTYGLSGTLGYTYGSYADLSGVSIKGGHPKGTAVLINGLLINQPQSGWTDLSDVSTFLFGKAEVWEGGNTPYSIYGNLNLIYVPDTVGYVVIGSRGTVRGGIKWGRIGGEGGLATRGRDSLLYAEGVWVLKGIFVDIRVSRKRTSGMEEFPQTSGIQNDARLALKSRWVNLLILRRTWKDWTGYYRHDNFRLTKNFEIYGFFVGASAEGVRSTNTGSHIRPLLSIGREYRGKHLYLSGGVWTDTRRIGYSAVAGVRRGITYAEALISNRIPSFDELYWEGAGAKGNPDLKNERNLGLSGGFLWKAARLDVYFRKMYDLVEWRPVGGIWRPNNVGSARVWGAEAKLNVGWLIFRYARAYAYDDEGKRLIYRPRNTYYLSLAPSFRTWGVLLSGVYVDPRFTNASNTRFVDYVLLVNGGAWIKLKEVKVAFSVYNLLNGKYYFVEGYPLPGRTFQLRLSFAGH